GLGRRRQTGPRHVRAVGRERAARPRGDVARPAQIADQDEVHHEGGRVAMPSKAVELRELPDDELYVRIESAKEELFNLRFQLATGQLDNTARLKELRHDVARLATVLREREIELELDTIAAGHALEDVAEEGGA